LIGALGGAERSVGEWVKEQIGGLVLRVGTWIDEHRRGAITDAAFPATGDILLYQARSQDIRNFIKQRIADVAPPRILLAHSLGDIACVDLLVAEPLDVQLMMSPWKPG
jgi:hypothetical protein